MNRRLGQLGRAALLEALSSGHQGRIDRVAQQLQLNLLEEVEEAMGAVGDVESSYLGTDELKAILPEKVRATASLWRLDRRETFEVPEDDDSPPPSIPSANWDGRPKAPPRYQLLQEPDVFIHQYLDPILNEAATSGRKLDTEKLVKQISQAKALTRLPRKPRRFSLQTLQVIDDRHSHLIPYWTDQSVYRFLSLARQGDMATEAILQEGRQRPIHLDNTKGYRGWEIPPPGSTVLILSDLGALSQKPDTQINTWLDIGGELQKNNCRGIVLLPCQSALCDKRFKSYFDLIPLIEQPTRNTGTEYIDSSVSLLLTALAPALRIEPGLLRQMRLDMAQHGERWSVGSEAESFVWQHADIQENHSVAATWNPSARAQRLEQFSQLSTAEKNTALNVIKQWRQPLSAQVWFEEIISLDDESRLLQADDVRVAVSYFEQLSQSMQDDGVLANEVDLKEWLQRVTLRVPKEVFESYVVGDSLQKIKYKVLPNHKDGIDPSKLPKSRDKTKTVMLYQQGEYLKIMPFHEQYDPEPGFSPLATLKMGHDFLQVKVDGKQVGVLSSAANPEVPLPKESKVMSIISDQEALQFEVLEKEEWSGWASAVGRDQYGLYADINLTPEHLQRFRWITPGRFLMGSPKSEKSRLDDELQRLVTLDKGYWLANTAVTQAQWKGLMGENPSRFKGDMLPVESISIERVQDFLFLLNQRISPFNFQLPDEAQWEYACRAGTTTVFSFGDSITEEQVNIDWGRSDQEATIPVATLPCNAWGLFEMHGNVVEICTLYEDEDSVLVEDMTLNSEYIFISYSHQDESWKDRIQSQLSVLEKQSKLHFWDDQEVSLGSDLLSEIEYSLEKASIVLLLVSHNYLNSSFFRNKEFQNLLHLRGQSGLKIIPVMLSPCRWDDSEWLSKMQRYPLDNKSLSEMTDRQADTALEQLVLSLLGGGDPDKPVKAVGKGGSWDTSMFMARSACRLSGTHRYIEDEVGFRLAFQVPSSYKSVAQLYGRSIRAQDKGNDEAALEYLREALIFQRKKGDKKGEGSTLEYIAQVYDSRSEYDLALKYLKESLLVLGEEGGLAMQANLLSHMATVTQSMADDDLTLQYLEQSIQLRQRIRDRLGEADVAGRIAEFFRVQGDFKKALSYSEKALSIYVRIGDRPKEADIVGRIADIFRAQGDLATADEFQENALILRSKLSDEI